MYELMAGGAYFLSIFFKAFQQRNVAFMHFVWVFPTSYLLAITDLSVTGLVVLKVLETQSFTAMIPMAFAVGTGGACGSSAAMWLHHRYIHHE